jgi:hypothetical protein
MKSETWTPAPDRKPVAWSLDQARHTIQIQRPATIAAPLTKLHAEAPKVSAHDEWLEQAMARQEEKRTKAKAAQEAEHKLRVEMEAIATSLPQEWPEPQAWALNGVKLSIAATCMGTAFAVVHWGLTVLEKLAH